MISNRLRTLLIMVLVALTILNNVAGLFVRNFQPSTEINGAFVLLMGVVIATYSNKNNGTGGNP